MPAAGGEMVRDDDGLASPGRQPCGAAPIRKRRHLSCFSVTPYRSWRSFSSSSSNSWNDRSSSGLANSMEGLVFVHGLTGRATPP